MSTLYTYYLGLGSNLQPAHHLSIAISRLQAEFAQLLLWPVVKTQPVDITTKHEFFNTLVVLRSERPPEALKAWTNRLEEACGRDRADPDSSNKDRPLDIDILAQQSELDLDILKQFKEPYIQAVIQAANEPASTTTCAIEVAGYQLGQRAATINADHASGHIVVIEDCVDSLLQRFKASLHREQCFG